MPQVFKLFRLQNFDSQIDQLIQQQKRIYTELEDDARIKQSRYELDEFNKILINQQKKLKNVEEKGKALQIKLEQNQSSLYGGRINNPKELTDLQQEAASLRNLIQAVEEDQLNLMIEVETSQQQHTNMQNSLNQLEHEFEARREELRGELDILTNQLDRLKEERLTIAKTTFEEDLKLYDSIRAKRGGIAVAVIVDQACSACGSTLSASLVHQAKSPNILAFCDTCGRILYSG